MKLHLIDLENTGTNFLKSFKADFEDKVIVFSKCPNIENLCLQRGYRLCNSYPKVKNSADFFICFYLSEVLALHIKIVSQVICYSKDKALVESILAYCEYKNILAEQYKNQDSKISNVYKIESEIFKKELLSLCNNILDSKHDTLSIKFMHHKLGTYKTHALKCFIKSKGSKFIIDSIMNANRYKGTSSEIKKLYTSLVNMHINLNRKIAVL